MHDAFNFGDAMDTLVRHRKERQPPRGQRDPLRIRLIGSGNARTRAVEKRLQQAGMTVQRFPSMEDGALNLDSKVIDAVIYVAPSVNHLAAIELLQSCRQPNSYLPLIVVAPTKCTSRCLDAGADDCVAQSIVAKELEARVRASIQKGVARANRICAFDLIIDSQTRLVTRAGKTIHLTPREFAILEMLAANRGKVVTRLMIWQQLYNHSTRNTSNLVDVYIRYLRQKIDDDASPALILTVWGRGYMLRGDQENEVG
jgi:two-component system, OmpR family, response regulator